MMDDVESTLVSFATSIMERGSKVKRVHLVAMCEDGSIHAIEAATKSIVITRKLSDMDMFTDEYHVLIKMSSHPLESSRADTPRPSMFRTSGAPFEHLGPDEPSPTCVSFEEAMRNIMFIDSDEEPPGLFEEAMRHYVHR